MTIFCGPNSVTLSGKHCMYSMFVDGRATHRDHPRTRWCGDHCSVEHHRPQRPLDKEKLMWSRYDRLTFTSASVRQCVGQHSADGVSVSLSAAFNFSKERRLLIISRQWGTAAVPDAFNADAMSASHYSRLEPSAGDFLSSGGYLSHFRKEAEEGSSLAR